MFHFLQAFMIINYSVLISVCNSSDAWRGYADNDVHETSSRNDLFKLIAFHVMTRVFSAAFAATNIERDY